MTRLTTQVQSKSLRRKAKYLVKLNMVWKIRKPLKSTAVLLLFKSIIILQTCVDALTKKTFFSKTPHEVYLYLSKVQNENSSKNMIVNLQKEKLPVRS